MHLFNNLAKVILDMKSGTLGRPPELPWWRLLLVLQERRSTGEVSCQTEAPSVARLPTGVEGGAGQPAQLRKRRPARQRRQGPSKTGALSATRPAESGHGKSHLSNQIHRSSLSLFLIYFLLFLAFSITFVSFEIIVNLNANSKKKNFLNSIKNFLQAHLPHKFSMRISDLVKD